MLEAVQNYTLLQLIKALTESGKFIPFKMYRI